MGKMSGRVGRWRATMRLSRFGLLYKVADLIRRQTVRRGDEIIETVVRPALIDGIVSWLSAGRQQDRLLF
jgi:hypothetical protein